jgi:hypothetical protein
MERIGIQQRRLFTGFTRSGAASVPYSATASVSNSVVGTLQRLTGSALEGVRSIPKFRSLREYARSAAGAHLELETLLWDLSASGAEPHEAI